METGNPAYKLEICLVSFAELTPTTQNHLRLQHVYIYLYFHDLVECLNRAEWKNRIIFSQKLLRSPLVHNCSSDTILELYLDALNNPMLLKISMLPIRLNVPRLYLVSISVKKLWRSQHIWRQEQYEILWVAWRQKISETRRSPANETSKVVSSSSTSLRNNHVWRFLYFNSIWK